MKNIIKLPLIPLTLILLWISSELQAQTIIWQEDFNDISDWTIDYTGDGFFDIDGGVFRAEKTMSEGILTSGWITISGSEYVEINFDEFTLGLEAEDHIEGYYKLEPSDSAILFYEDGDFIQNIISGTKVQLIFKIKNNDFWFFLTFNDIFTLDNIRIIESSLPTLYAMDNGEWDYQGGWPSYNTIWSYDDYSGIQNSCDCFPDATTAVVIGKGYTVDMDEDGTARGVRIENSGKLNFTATAQLNIAQGGDVIVESDGVIDRNNEDASLIFLDDGQTSNIVVTDGIIDIRDIEVDGQNAAINISGNGSLNVNRRFSIEENGSVVNNNFSGTFTIGEDLRIQGSDVRFINNNLLSISGNLWFNDDKSTVTNNGVLFVDNLIVNNNNDNDNVFINNAGAFLNIANTIDLNNGNFTINNSGTINQAGNFVAIDIGSNFYNLDGSNWNFAGDDFDNSMSNVLSCDNGTNVFNYNRSEAQDIIIPVDAYSTLTVSGSGTKEARDDLDINQDLNITGSAGLDVRGNDINLAGDWNNTSSNGDSFDQDNSRVTFDGNTQYIINSSGEEVFDELEVNNNNLVLNSEVTIDNTMTFTDGIVTSTMTNLLVFEDGATSSLPLVTSFVNGPVRKKGDDDFIFPIGKGTVLAPIAIADLNNADGSNTHFTAEYFPVPAPNADDLPASGLSHVSSIEYWELDKTGPGEAIVGLITVDKDRSDIYEGTLEDVVVAHYNEGTSEWEALGTEHGLIAGNLFSVRTTGPVFSFDSFTFGSSGGISPLPVTLVSFSGESTMAGNWLLWHTTWETENDYFSVERSKDGNAWEALDQVRGIGNTSQAHDYSYLDENPFPGSSFYRLKQVDFNGEFKYSKIISVRNVQVPQPGIRLLYPNPVKEKVTLQYISSGEGELILSVTNQQGIQQIRKRFHLQGRQAEITVDLGGLPSGLYFLILHQNDNRIVEKILKD